VCDCDELPASFVSRTWKYVVCLFCLGKCDTRCVYAGESHLCRCGMCSVSVCGGCAVPGRAGGVKGERGGAARICVVIMYPRKHVARNDESAFVRGGRASCARAARRRAVSAAATGGLAAESIRRARRAVLAAGGPELQGLLRAHVRLLRVHHWRGVGLRSGRGRGGGATALRA